MEKSGRGHSKVRFVRAVLAGISSPLGLLCAVNFPDELTRANSSITSGEKSLYTSLVVLLYFAILVLSFRSIRAASLLANLFCLFFTPYVALLLFFSGWTSSSARAGHWLSYLLIGNVVLFIMSVIGLILSFRKE